MPRERAGALVAPVLARGQVQEVTSCCRVAGSGRQSRPRLGWPLSSSGCAVNAPPMACQTRSTATPAFVVHVYADHAGKFDPVDDRSVSLRFTDPLHGLIRGNISVEHETAEA